MLDTALKAQLKAHLLRLQRPIELIASVDGGAPSSQLRRLLADIAECSSLVRVVERDDGERVPSFAIAAEGEPSRVRFAGVPLGHEFTSLVLALLQVGGHPPRIDDEVAARARALDGDAVFEVYMSLSCHNCPDVVQALNTLAVLNPRVRVVTIDGAQFQDEVASRQVMAVPSVFLNGQAFGQGRMGLEEILARLDTSGGQRDADRLSAKPVYDVLVVGGGPAGAAAAVYAARKGIRTGVVAERFGGQTLDTLAIENFISVPHTEGPRFAAALESHVRDYGVDVMHAQRVVALRPAEGPGEPLQLDLANGATLRGRSVVLATGARWREVGVPGEREYRGKGVAYCPHCDGPLFKGKRVAVIGGGNSGVEAAIDLAGLAHEVTLLEFGDRLRADAVLVDKLRSLRNVRVITQAQTTEITGSQGQVDGLVYADRASGRSERVPLEGVFVQIGLVPNTEWLSGVLDLSRSGEIVTDARGRTSIAGVFAAGDATTVPYKQIVIAAGEGAKAALSAFDHLMRQPAVATPATVT